jgi:hypothetical protein
MGIVSVVGVTGAGDSTAAVAAIVLVAVGRDGGRIAAAAGVASITGLALSALGVERLVAG